MPFQSFNHFGEVARLYQITLAEAEFLTPLPTTVNSYFRDEIAFAQREMVFDNSEGAVCENLIAPVLREAWKPYTTILMLWSHEPLRFDDTLQGIPDYFVAKRSPLGKWVREEPYLILVEAKRDDFEKGWAQCLAAMLAAQKSNPNPDTVIHGIVSNGDGWEFGKLAGKAFVKHPRLWTIYDLDTLMAALHFIFEECKQQLTGKPVAA